jgi:cadmium resistance protein CadD (predicted permease)
MGVWKLFGLLLSEKEEELEKPNVAGMKSIPKVSVVTVMNGGDNIGTYDRYFHKQRELK